MVQRTRFEDANCPVARALDVVGDWWSLLIVRDAFDGARRFNDFQKRLGVSRGILAARFHTLVARGVLERAPASDGGAHQEYALTERGRDLFPVVVALRQWGEDHCFTPGETRSVLVEADTGRPVARLEVRSAAGHRLAAPDTEVRKVVGGTPPRRAGRGRSAGETAARGADQGSTPEPKRPARSRGMPERRRAGRDRT